MLSLGIKAKGVPLQIAVCFVGAKPQMMASKPGLSLLEGMMRHRFLFSRNTLPKLVAFQTAAGAGQRLSLRPEKLLPTTPVHSSQLALLLAAHPWQFWPVPQPKLPDWSRRCSLLEGPWGLATGGCSSDFRHPELV